jgi:fatty-acyl-CoA synthase
MNIGEWVRKWASIRPDKIAIICEETTLTYGQLASRVNRLANLIHRKGIKKGDRVAVLLYNSKEYVEIVLALSITGAILVPLNFRLSGEELEFILKDSESETLVFDEEFMHVVEAIKGNIPIREGNYICVGKAISSWAIHYEKTVMGESPEEFRADRPIDGEDPQIIMYTSGTTGLPKGTILSHRKTFYNVLNADIFYGLTSEDIILVSRALFHSGGLLVETAPMLYKGGTIILKKRFRPQEILEAIEKHRVTVIEAAATMYNFILQQCDLKKYDLSSLRCCFTGGERVPPSLLKEYLNKGITISQCYGQTETSTIAWLPLEEAQRKLGSVGIPVFHGNVKIVDKEGKEVKPGEVGEIIVSGPILMTGYWRKPQQTGETIKDGWLHTGDLAKKDEEGFLYVVDRGKDMFISGGENVYPAEVEKIYLENPNILNVAVVGVPDERWGEVGIVFIVMKEGEELTEEEALKLCEGRIARYKIPRQVVFLTELPMTASQKIRRNKLREDYLGTQELGKQL